MCRGVQYVDMPPTPRDVVFRRRGYHHYRRLAYKMDDGGIWVRFPAVIRQSSLVHSAQTDSEAHPSGQATGALGCLVSRLRMRGVLLPVPMHLHAVVLDMHRDSFTLEIFSPRCMTWCLGAGDSSSVAAN
jgi:hypothetical protein